MIPKLSIALALCSLLCATGGPLLARAQLIPSMVGMGLFLLSGLVGLVAIGVALVAAVRFQAYLPAMIGVLGLLPLLAVIATTIQSTRYPAINDITTDLESPPVFKRATELPPNADRDMSFPAAFVEPIKVHYDDLATLPLNAAPEIAYRRARDMATQEPFYWEITRDDEATLTFEAIDTTRIFQWKDDIILRVRPDGEAGSYVDMRSKSRDGKSDLGANATRIRRFFEALNY